MRNKTIVIGTAGHIDHGKSSLVKALTGVDPDRLEEEKQRQITIDLGFANMTLPSGRKISIVDVPGHEKFIKNMLLGASGINFVIMVISAEEGIMPQTIEHFQICSILGVKQGIIALSKTDKIDEEWLGLVTEDIKSYFKDSFLENAKIVPISIKKPESILHFIESLDESLQKQIFPKQSQILKIPIDRVFSMKGFGTVVTGTLSSGKIKQNDQIMIYPDKILAKAKRIQVHNNDQDEAESFARVALNLHGIEKEKIRRGSLISQENFIKPSLYMDLYLKCVKGAGKIKKEESVKLHVGTSQLNGKIFFFDKKKDLKEEEQAFVRIKLNDYASCIGKDNFVLRRMSPAKTIGGGVVLMPFIFEGRKRFSNYTNFLEILLNGEDQDIVLTLISESKTKGIDLKDLQVISALDKETIDNIVRNNSDNVIKIDEKYLHADEFKTIVEKIIVHLKNFHKEKPLETGLAKEELKSRLKYIDEKILEFAILTLVKTKKLQQNLGLLFLDNVKLSKSDQKLKDMLTSYYKEAKFSPCTQNELVAMFNADLAKIKGLIQILIKENKLVKINEDLFFSNQAISELKEKIKKFIEKKGSIEPKDVKGMMQASRKFVIPALEYLDKESFTIRVDNKRILR